MNHLLTNLLLISHLLNDELTLVKPLLSNLLLVNHSLNNWVTFY